MLSLAALAGNEATLYDPRRRACLPERPRAAYSVRCVEPRALLERVGTPGAPSRARGLPPGAAQAP